MGIDLLVFDDSEMIPLFPIDGDDGIVVVLKMKKCIFAEYQIININ